MKKRLRRNNSKHNEEKKLFNRDITQLEAVICSTCKLDMKISWLVKNATVVLIHCPTVLKGHSIFRVRLKDVL